MHLLNLDVYLVKSYNLRAKICETLNKKNFILFFKVLRLFIDLSHNLLDCPKGIDFLSVSFVNAKILYTFEPIRPPQSCFQLDEAKGIIF